MTAGTIQTVYRIERGELVKSDTESTLTVEASRRGEWLNLQVSANGRKPIISYGYNVSRKTWSYGTEAPRRVLIAAAVLVGINQTTPEWLTVQAEPVAASRPTTWADREAEAELRDEAGYGWR